MGHADPAIASMPVVIGSRLSDITAMLIDALPGGHEHHAGEPSYQESYGALAETAMNLIGSAT